MQTWIEIINLLFSEGRKYFNCQERAPQNSKKLSTPNELEIRMLAKDWMTPLASPSRRLCSMRRCWDSLFIITSWRGREKEDTSLKAECAKLDLNFITR